MLFAFLGLPPLADTLGGTSRRRSDGWSRPAPYRAILTADALYKRAKDG